MKLGIARSSQSWRRREEGEWLRWREMKEEEVMRDRHDLQTEVHFTRVLGGSL